jgi:hypothetical protein
MECMRASMIDARRRESINGEPNPQRDCESGRFDLFAQVGKWDSKGQETSVEYWSLRRIGGGKLKRASCDPVTWTRGTLLDQIGPSKSV